MELEAIMAQMKELQAAVQARTMSQEEVSEIVAKALANEQSKPATPAPYAPTPGTVDIKTLISRPAKDEDVAELQRLNDAVMFSKNLNPLGWQGGEAMAKFREKAAMYTTGSGVGAEFVPETWSNQLEMAMRLENRVPGLFRQVAMPQSPYHVPVGGAVPTSYLIPEATTDNASFVPSGAYGTAECVLTAKTLGVRVPFSIQLNQDSIVEMTPALTEVVGVALTDAIEDAIINGDTAGNVATTISDLTNDRRAAWNGLRTLAFTATATNYDASTLTEASFVGARQKLSVGYQNPSDLVYIVSPFVWGAMCNATNFPSFVSMDKVGTLAANVQGEVGQLWGSPVVVSQHYRHLQDNAGKDTGAGTYTGFIVANRRAFALGIAARSIVTIYNPETLQFATVGHVRAAFAPYNTQGTTTFRATASGYKVNTAG